LEPVAGSSRYPRRERISTAYLGDYVTGNDLEYEDDDQVMSGSDSFRALATGMEGLDGEGGGGGQSR